MADFAGAKDYRKLLLDYSPQARTFVPLFRSCVILDASFLGSAGYPPTLRPRREIH